MCARKIALYYVGKAEISEHRVGWNRVGSKPIIASYPISMLSIDPFLYLQWR